MDGSGPMRWRSLDPNHCGLSEQRGSDCKQYLPSSTICDGVYLAWCMQSRDQPCNTRNENGSETAVEQLSQHRSWRESWRAGRVPVLLHSRESSSLVSLGKTLIVRCSLDSLGAFTDKYYCGPAVTRRMHSNNTHSQMWVG